MSSSFVISSVAWIGNVSRSDLHTFRYIIDSLLPWLLSNIFIHLGVRIDTMYSSFSEVLIVLPLQCNCLHLNEPSFRDYNVKNYKHIIPLARNP